MSQQPADPDVTIFIYEDCHGGSVRAEPGHAAVRRGQTVAWENLTGSELRVAFATPEIFDGGMEQVLRVPPGEASEPTRIAGGARRGNHPYLGVAHREQQTDQCVEGGSLPTLIIR